MSGNFEELMVEVREGFGDKQTEGTDFHDVNENSREGALSVEGELEVRKQLHLNYNWTIK